MAHSLSAKQRIRRNGRRADINGGRRSRIRTFERKVDEAVAAGNKDAALAALKEAQPELQRAVTKGVLHQNTVSRKISRISARIKAM